MSPKVCSSSKIESRISSYWKFMQIETSGFTSKNVIFNGSLFTKLETAIRFVTLKWVWDWSQFLIKNSISLLQNKAPFDSNQLSKLRYFTRKSMPTTLSSWTEGSITTRRLRGIDWHLETMVGVVGESVSLLLGRAPARAVHRCCWQHFGGWEMAFPPINVLWFTLASTCASTRHGHRGLQWCRELATRDIYIYIYIRGERGLVRERDEQAKGKAGEEPHRRSVGPSPWVAEKTGKRRWGHRDKSEKEERERELSRGYMSCPLWAI